MNEFVAVENLSLVLANEVVIPTITLWNRLEGRPRTHDFDRALKAEVRDPLWMLAKQWQMGEFRGDDAGSPVTAKVHIETTRVTKYKPAGGVAEAFDDDVPLEAKVERRPVPFSQSGHVLALDIRLAMGRRWLKLAAAIEPGFAKKFVVACAIVAPDPSVRADAPVAAHREAWQAVAAVAGRAMDGWLLYDHLTKASGNHAYDLVALGDPSHAPLVEAAETEFLAWYAGLLYQPPADQETAWEPDRLEYGFDLSAPQAGAEKHLVADEYYQGHLDWYNLDVDGSGTGLGGVTGESTGVEAAATASFVPVPIQFSGMPNTRWWTFEDGQTNFGDIDAGTTDVNKLLLIEFGLVYANDWFLMPFTVPAGTIARVRGIMTTNTFGERTWIEPAGKGSDADWQRWSMYTLATRGSDDIPADLSLVIVPSVATIQDGEPLEAVQLVRDEIANMVWGIETRVALASGESKSGRSAALDVARYHTRLVEAAPAPPAAVPLANEAAIRYQVMTTVPENWIPFVPVHIPGDNREIQLRRAAMLRLIENDPLTPIPIEPRTNLLRAGLDLAVPKGYDLHEEEVPRAGVRVTQSFRRTRWYDGQVFTWLGVRKETGRGESSSSLRFDQIPPKPR